MVEVAALRGRVEALQGQRGRGGAAAGWVTGAWSTLSHLLSSSLALLALAPLLPPSSASSAALPPLSGRLAFAELLDDAAAALRAQSSAAAALLPPLMGEGDGLQECWTKEELSAFAPQLPPEELSAALQWMECRGQLQRLSPSLSSNTPSQSSRPTSSHLAPVELFALGSPPSVHPLLYELGLLRSSLARCERHQQGRQAEADRSLSWPTCPPRVAAPLPSRQSPSSSLFLACV